jgi:hypothetical protein
MNKAGGCNWRAIRLLLVTAVCRGWWKNHQCTPGLRVCLFKPTTISDKNNFTFKLKQSMHRRCQLNTNRCFGADFYPSSPVYTHEISFEMKLEIKFCMRGSNIPNDSNSSTTDCCDFSLQTCCTLWVVIHLWIKTSVAEPEPLYFAGSPCFCYLFLLNWRCSDDQNPSKTFTWMWAAPKKFLLLVREYGLMINIQLQSFFLDKG